MDKEFENLLKQTKPEMPGSLRESVLRKAAEAWTEDDVEHQLANCTTTEPRDELRSSTLAAAKAEWQRPRQLLTFKRWAVAAAAVFAFAIGGAWYDSLPKQARVPVHARTPRIFADELLADLNLDQGTQYLVGVRHSDVSKMNNQTTWLGARRILKH